MPFLILVLMGGALFWLYRRDRRRMLESRGSFFRRMDGLVDWPSEKLQPDGFPVLRGSYRGTRVVLRATSDTLMMRRLPQLWLEASVLMPLPDQGTLSYLLRPCNTEIFSPSMRLPVRLDVPASWPKEAAMLRCDDPDNTVPLERLTPHLAICADRRMKEVLITPRGVRLIYQADEGDRSAYLLLRQARFDGGPADPKLVQRLLDAAVAIAEDLRVQVAEPAQIHVAPDKADRRVGDEVQSAAH